MNGYGYFTEGTRVTKFAGGLIVAELSLQKAVDFFDYRIAIAAHVVRNHFGGLAASRQRSFQSAHLLRRRKKTARRRLKSAAGRAVMFTRSIPVDYLSRSE
ncbi:hypothetical protein [Paenibacillus glycinis]|uniref:Uncharacterized protein n=1 Tax=Paenibacillus glycinis TaxID=2697035 RepID=A0ABW9XUI5_9BACL|nr:hypothetical protein [Paenibacillus glycinis]NBD26006.1 hypothetical protein [Paenibacillus glycinis]